MIVKVPPIKCQGIKTKLVPLIKQSVNRSDSGLWIEPFRGSGVVGFNLLPKRAIFSDINPNIIRFYQDIKCGFITHIDVRTFLMEEGMKLLTIGEDHYYEIRKRFNDNPNSLDFLFLNRSCFNGVMRFNKKMKFNVPFCRKPNRYAKSYITKIVNQVIYIENAIKNNSWEFICQDFTKTISTAIENDFIYIDFCLCLYL